MINYNKIIEKILDDSNYKGKLGIIFGSGLGIFSDELTNKIKIPYKEIPGYPIPSVKGHAGELLVGNIGSAQLIAAKGRFHLYEGYSFEEITIPIHVFSKLGVEYLIITNAAGSMNTNFPPGSLMTVNGHMDCTYRENSNNPNLYEGKPFHDPHLIEIASKCAKKIKIKIHSGVYCWTLGPSYETPAEIKNMVEMNGDAVGMSTVPEIITAAELGMKILTISCLTNYASGMSDNPLSHDEVVENAKSADDIFSKLLREIIINIDSLA